MIDVDRLKEVVDRGTVQVEHGMPLMPSVAHDLLAAARLVVAGQPLWWCETHGVSGWSEDECWKQVWGDDDDYVTDGMCRMVEGVWVPTGKETDR